MRSRQRLGEAIQFFAIVVGGRCSAQWLGGDRCRQMREDGSRRCVLHDPRLWQHQEARLRADMALKAGAVVTAAACAFSHRDGRRCLTPSRRFSRYCSNHNALMRWEYRGVLTMRLFRLRLLPGRSIHLRIVLEDRREHPRPSEPPRMKRGRQVVEHRTASDPHHSRERGRG